MRFVSYLPCDALKPYIKSFAIQETAEETIYNVLPDTGVVIGFQYKGRLSRLFGEKETALSPSGISGLADHARTFKNSPHIGTVLVFFKEAGATPFFRQPLHELFRQSLSLDNFMLRSELLLLEEQLAAAPSDLERIATIEKFLLGRMSTTPPDKLVLEALHLIHQSQGNIRISELSKQLHISQSPLEKRFRAAVGTSPKKLASIIRLQQVLRQHRLATSLTELGHEAGFYDQAHFIKEFKTFTGFTPQHFFASKKVNDH